MYLQKILKKNKKKLRKAWYLCNVALDLQPQKGISSL